jgi:hypothetical protein
MRPKVIGDALALPEDVHQRSVNCLVCISSVPNSSPKKPATTSTRCVVLIDISALGLSGYQAADWLRENQPLDMGLSDHRQIEATMSMTTMPSRPPASLRH